MKKKLAFIFAAAVLGLAACGGESAPASGEKTPADTSQKSGTKTSGKSATSKTSKSQTSRTSAAPRPSASLSSVDVVAKENKLYLQLKGSFANVEAANLKFALGLLEYNSGSEEANWLVGKETPAEADYNLTATIAEKNWTLDYCVSDIANVKAGIYNIYFGAASNLIEYAALGADFAEVSGAKAGLFRGYTRSDQNVGSTLSLCLDELPPIALTEAKVVYEGEKLYAMIGGETTKTLEELNAYDSFLNFQNTNGYSNTRVQKMVDEPVEGTYYYTYVVDGAKAYIKADVSFFTAGGNYNTHLNITKNTQANCKLDVSVDQNYDFEALNLRVNVFCDTTKGQADGADYFWGNLGFRVSALHEESEPIEVE